MAQFRTGLITGGSVGIGLELAHLAARDCDSLVLVGRSSAHLSEAQELLLKEHPGVTVHVICQDLAAPGAAREVVRQVDALGCEVDLLVNNAGVGYDARFVESDGERQQGLVSTNVVALTELTHAFAPQMVVQGHGAILNVASVAGFLPGPNMATYYASKAYVQSLTLALHAELGPQVKVTALCPGPVRTEFWERADAGRTVLARMALPAPAIAHAGYCALAANRALCAPGLTAKAIVFLSRLMPRVILGRIAGLLQRPSGRS